MTTIPSQCRRRHRAAVTGPVDQIRPGQGHRDRRDVTSARSSSSSAGLSLSHSSACGLPTRAFTLAPATPQPTPHVLPSRTPPSPTSTILLLLLLSMGRRSQADSTSRPSSTPQTTLQHAFQHPVSLRSPPSLLALRCSIDIYPPSSASVQCQPGVSAHRTRRCSAADRGVRWIDRLPLTASPVSSSRRHLFSPRRSNVAAVMLLLRF